MVLAIARADLCVTLIESDSKKCAFLQTVSRETLTPVSIQNERIEKAALVLPPPDIITARALAALPQLLDWAHPWLKQNAALQAIFPKGERAEEELVAAKKEGWAFHVKQIPSVTEPQASLLNLTNLGKN